MFDKDLEDCTLCPRECHVNRLVGEFGYCKSGSGYSIASICRHMGEEPVISGENGICNVFFTHCNIQCVYCQNFQISRNNNHSVSNDKELDEVVSEIIAVLDTGTNLLGFVSPSHFIPQMKAIISKLHELKRNPVIVYNSNGYDKVETLKTLEHIVDIYLPDFKYSDAKLALELSDAPHYPETALLAIKEMIRQKGTSLKLGENSQIETGVIVRHLVIPGHVENSINALKMLAEEISPLLTISLMSQYYPAADAKNIKEINCSLRAEEYEQVVDALHQFGFHRGWVQDLESHGNYRPDFLSEKPFGK